MDERMIERELEQLSQLPLPEPSLEVRSRAVESALLVFDAVARRSRNRTRVKGIRALARLISVLTDHAWRWIMERRLVSGALAATVLALPIAVQIARHASDDRLSDLASYSTGLPTVRTHAPLGPTPAASLQGSKTTDAASPIRTTATSAHTGPGRLAEVPPAPPLRAGALPRDAVTSLPAVPGIPRGLSTSKWSERQAADSLLRRNQGLADRRAKEIAGRSVSPMVTEPGEFSRSSSNRDNFHGVESNTLRVVADEPVSTFSVDVDTASYAIVRRMLEQGTLPPAAAVRTEELINYFPYDYPGPDSGEVPFRVSVDVYPTPWNPQTKLLHIGLKGYEITPAERPRANLVFLIDTSGSMEGADRLPLLKNGFRLLLDRLNPDDVVSIVTYAGRAATALEPTRVGDRHQILAALDNLDAGGSTAGQHGIRRAYAIARSAFIEDGINRVILATDGDFNVGITDVGELEHYIADQRQDGVYLSVLGFGRGNYNDAVMQALAQNGNGNAAYVDTFSEARKVLVEEATSTLFPIASDVKVQVEFNPATVAEYRLIGYETRALHREDFNNDRIDAGDVGSGHTVTALYEITPNGSPARLVDRLRYRPESTSSGTGDGEELAFVKLRYKLPGQQESKSISIPVTAESGKAAADIDDDLRFAAAVAAFGQKLRGDPWVADYSYDALLALARGARGEDQFGYRGEFLDLVSLAKALDHGNRRR